MRRIRSRTRAPSRWLRAALKAAVFAAFLWMASDMVPALWGSVGSDEFRQAASATAPLYAVVLILAIMLALRRSARSQE